MMKKSKCCNKDILSVPKYKTYSDEITLGISSRKMDNFDNVIIREHKLGLMRGATYTGGTSSLIPTSEIGENRLWLCPATLRVFWRYPKKIYFKIL